MNPADKKGLIGLYEERYARLGHDVRTLGWNSRDDQRLRFKVLCDVADLSGASVCDLGCGFGDLIGYLRDRFGQFSYTGVDLSPSLVEKARQLHPSCDLRCVDVLKESFVDRFDYFLLSGALNFRMEDNWKLTTDILSLAFSLANKGVAANFLSTYVNFQKPVNYHHSPERVFAFGRRLTKWVTLRHDYPLWEFTLYLYKNPNPDIPEKEDA
jgi:SAM-dependent methyltransferase